MPLQPTLKVCFECSGTPHYGKGLCRSCYMRVWKLTHKAEVKAYNDIYHAAHREQERIWGRNYMRARSQEAAAYSRQYYHAHLEERRERARAAQLRRRTEDHATYIAKKRAYLASHKEEERTYKKLQYERNSEPYKERAHRRRVATSGPPIDWQAVYDRDRGVCHICRKPVERKSMSLDHVIPLSKGGTHTFENVRASHKRCNIQRQNRGVGQPYLL